MEIELTAGTTGGMFDVRSGVGVGHYRYWGGVRAAMKVGWRSTGVVHLSVAADAETDADARNCAGEPK